MKKNVASQSIGAEMITAADGTAFTGTVTVLITIDNGTQSASGGTAPAHEGNGYHSYTPTQAETNGDHIAFTFTGTGAVPATVQVFTSFPQTVDNNVLAAGATGFAAIDTVVDAILVDTGTTIPASITALNDVAATDIVSAGAITTSSGAVSTVTTCTTTTTNTDMRGTDSAATAANLATVDTNVDSILVDTAEIGTAGAGLTNINLPNQTMDITGNLSGSVGSVTGGATSAAQTTAQNDLDIITGASGVNLLTATQASIDAIEADTNELQTDWANGGRLDLLLDAIPTTAMRGTDSAALASVCTETRLAELDAANLPADLDAVLVDTGTTIPALIGTPAADVSADIAAVKVDTAATLVDTVILTSVFKVGAAVAGTLSTTQMSTNLTEATDDHYNGRLITWTSGVLLEQQTDITDYTGATKVLTFTTTTDAPSSTDTFVIT